MGEGIERKVAAELPIFHASRSEGSPVESVFKKGVIAATHVTIGQLSYKIRITTALVSIFKICY